MCTERTNKRETLSACGRNRKISTHTEPFPNLLET